MTNAERARRLAERIDQQVKRSAGKGLDAARIFLAARVKETINVPAPRRLVKSARGGRYYRATEPAIPGAPIRKVTGRAQQSVTSEISADGLKATVGLQARSDRGFNYPKHHERKGAGKHSGQHPFLLPTAMRWLGQLRTIIGQAIKFGWG